jgi:hypothetical protein
MNFVIPFIISVAIGFKAYNIFKGGPLAGPASIVQALLFMVFVSGWLDWTSMPLVTIANNIVCGFIGGKLAAHTDESIKMMNVKIFMGITLFIKIFIFFISFFLIAEISNELNVLMLIIFSLGVTAGAIFYGGKSHKCP